MKTIPRFSFPFSAALSLALFLTGHGRSAAAEPSAEKVAISMRDGVKLATDVYRPATNTPLPVILARTPYNKDGLRGLARDGLARGYVVVAQDARGRFASEGDNMPFDREAADGFDTMDWIARQPWCNGRIGTWGGSAGAIVQYQLAAAAPENLAAQFLMVGAPNLYDVVYVGGAFRKSLIEDWLRGTRFSSNALPRWVAHPSYDDYWRLRDATRRYRKINAPAVHVGGYWDIFAQATVDAFVGYQTKAGPGARGRQKLVLGPWAHAVLQEKVGELKFPGGNQPPGQVHDAWVWFEHCLKDAANGADHTPAVTYYVLGDTSVTNGPGNVWRQAESWPPTKTVPVAYYLHPAGTLSRQRSNHPLPLRYAYDPTNPAPTIGGNQLTIPAGPMDQRALESRGDVLVFSTEPLAHPVEVTGNVRAKLWVSTDVPDSDFIVRLCDVYPDGRSFNLCEGILRARFRDGYDHEKWLQPGRVYPLEIDLWPTSIIFNRGHRIRLHVTSSSAPGFDPNPNTGEPFRASTRTRVAHHAVHADSRHPSHVLLPMVSLAP